jgi:hypothetical protein
MTHSIDFFAKVPEKVIVETLLPYLRPCSTAPLSKKWHKMTQECETQSLSNVAARICNDFDCEQLHPKHLSKALKKFNGLTQKEPQDEIKTYTAMKKYLLKLTDEARKAKDYDHFSKTLREISMHSPCYIELLQQHYEHQQLFRTLKYINTIGYLTAAGVSNELKEEILGYVFPRSVEQQAKVEKVSYLCLNIMLGSIPAIYSEYADAQKFAELKASVSLKAHKHMDEIAKAMLSNKIAFFPAASESEIAAFSLREKLVLAISKYRREDEMLILSTLVLIYNLKIINERTELTHPFPH